MTLKRRGKRVICFGMMILLMLLCACTNEQKPTDDVDPVGAGTENYEIPEAYTEVLDAYAKLLLGTGEITEKTGPVGINSAIDLLSALDGADMAAEAPYRCGYLLKDLNDDGVPELLIGEISSAGKYEQENGVSYSGSIVQAVYTLADGEALNILEGWGRNRYDWTDVGHFFNRASAGAAHYIFADYKLSKDGRGLDCDGYWFTYDQEDGDEVRLQHYYNTSGEWDPAASEQISADEFQSAEAKLEKKIAMLPLTPFSQYESENVDPMGVPAVLRAAWANFFVAGYQSHDEYILSEEESAAKVAFFAQKPLKNFRVLNLEFVDADEDGNVLFQTKSMYKQKELMPDCPLVVQGVFYGSIPNWGVSYEDETGEVRTYSVSVSGMDGSIVLSPISVTK